MDDLLDRREAFETKLAKADGIQFKIAVLRNKLLGIWVGEPPKPVLKTEVLKPGWRGLRD